VERGSAPGTRSALRPALPPLRAARGVKNTAHNNPKESPMKPARTLALVAAAHAVTACSVGKISGEVDGSFVPAFHTGMVFEASGVSDADDYVALTAFYTFSNGCDLVAEQMDVRAEAAADLGAADDVSDLEELIDAVADFEADKLPDDYWAAYVVLAGEDDNDIEDDFDIEDDTVSVVVCHHSGAVDVDRDELEAALLPDFAAPFAKDSARDCYVAEEGEVRVSLYQESGSISLVAEVELVDDEGDDAGEIELGGLGGYCGNAEGAVEGLFEEFRDLSRQANAAGDNSCQFSNDGECDEPEGLNFCADGTDTNDCA
jgi:hypothetical protein